MEDAAYQSVVEAKVNSLTAQVGFHQALVSANKLISLIDVAIEQVSF